ncbi:hypothetical protein [Streptomyces sp. 6N223]|uniref:hypothetical protein n=1 Tax=Streptomyces sp. 6N223 TaxID=3457412 RepID=UPI003FCFB11D
MPNADAARTRTDFAESAAVLATHVLGALSADTGPDSGPDSGHGPGPGPPHYLADFVEAAPDPRPALAAVRILGADALAPHALTRSAPPMIEAAVVAESLRLFPPAHATANATANAPADADADDDANRDAQIAAWRDHVLAQLTGLDAPAPHAAPTPTPPDSDPPAWRAWSVTMAQLSPLALPGIDTSVHEAARHGRVSLARGAAWALLRRDHALAARLGRWLALLEVEGRHPLPLEPGPLLDHVLLLGGVEPRTVLEAEIGRRVLTLA